MESYVRGLRRAAVVMLTAVVGASCSNGGLAELPAEAGVSGTYSVSATRQAPSCSPHELPPPLLADTAQYVQLPTRSVSNSFNIHIQQTDQQLSIEPFSASGQPQPALALNGTFDTVYRIAQTSGAPLMRTEGPRQGGHTFYVTGARSATTQFLLTVTTPDGVARMAEATSGTEVYAFHDDGADGPTFTTCIVADSSSGNRTSP